MISRRRLLSLLSASVLLLGVVLWLLPRFTATSTDAASSGSPLDQEFDYFISAMQRVSFSAAGQITHTLDAQRVVHYPADDRAELEQPHLVWYPTDTPPWELTATEGSLYGNGNQANDLLQLRDQVVLRHSLRNGATLVARTSRLDAAIRAQEFHTDSPVTLTTDTLHMDSIGMHGNLRNNQFELLQHVRGRHDPVSTPP